VASTNNPSIPVFVFREEDIDFPVPYLTHYIDEPLSNKDDLFSRDMSKTVLNLITIGWFESFVDAIVKDQTISLSEEDPMKCSNCLINFQYIGVKEKIRCPCCSTMLTNS
jgi:hypothetical protein